MLSQEKNGNKKTTQRCLCRDGFGNGAGDGGGGEANVAAREAPRPRNLSRAELLVDLGRAPTIAAAWAQIRNAEREREWQQERRRRERWERYNARQNAADNACRQRPRKNEVNARRRWEFINRCFRVKAHIVRHAGVFAEKSREFYVALRAAELAVVGRIFAKRAAARLAAHVFALMQCDVLDAVREAAAETAKKNAPAGTMERAAGASYSQARARTVFLPATVSYHADGFGIYYTNNSKKGDKRPGTAVNNCRNSGVIHKKEKQHKGLRDTLLSAAREWRPKFSKNVRERIFSAKKTLKKLHDEESSGLVVWSSMIAGNMLETAFVLNVGFRRVGELYAELLRKWEHLAGTYGRGRKWLPTGLAHDFYAAFAAEIRAKIPVPVAEEF